MSWGLCARLSATLSWQEAWQAGSPHLAEIHSCREPLVSPCLLELPTGLVSCLDYLPDQTSSSSDPKKKRCVGHISGPQCLLVVEQAPTACSLCWN